MRTILIIIGVLLIATPAFAQATQTPENVARLAELVSKSAGPYKKIAEGVWETSYKGKNMSRILVRIATSGDGMFFIVSLFPRDKLVLDQDLLLKIAEFNANYDYVKLVLEKTSLDVRLDIYANLLDLAAFNALESLTALAADAAYGLLSPVAGSG
jgi:hypothetical protein